MEKIHLPSIAIITPCLNEELVIQKYIYDAIYWLWLASRNVMSPDNKQVKLLFDIESRLGF